MTPGKVNILEVQMKVIAGSGTYYKFVIRDCKGKEVRVKIDEVHP